MNQRSFFGIISVAALLGPGAPATAGEVDGQGDPIDVNGRSICAVSGLNDGDPPPGITQSFGQNVQADRLNPTNFDPHFVLWPKSVYPYPDWACSPDNIDLQADAACSLPLPGGAAFQGSITAVCLL